jgi:hypothetical protein
VEPFYRQESKRNISFLSTDQTGVQGQTELKWLIRLKGQIGPFSLNIKGKLYEMTDGSKKDKMQVPITGNNYNNLFS